MSDDQQRLAIDRIVQNKRTGERYIATPPELWAERLEAWKLDMRARHARLDPLSRIPPGGDWEPYYAAKRAEYERGLPCPMPEGHCMFENPAAYDCEAL